VSRFERRRHWLALRKKERKARLREARRPPSLWKRLTIRLVWLGMLPLAPFRAAWAMFRAWRLARLLRKYNETKRQLIQLKELERATKKRGAK